MLDLLTSALLGAGTGGIGTILGLLGKAAGHWVEEREKDGEHRRSMEMHRLQHDLRSEELEVEREITMEEIRGALREASYQHDMAGGKTSRWVNDVRGMVRPTLTGVLVILLGVIFFFAAPGDKATIVHSLTYAAMTAITWWFGDRQTQVKKK